MPTYGHLGKTYEVGKRKGAKEKGKQGKSKLKWSYKLRGKLDNSAVLGFNICIDPIQTFVSSYI
jgi:hypothetical protein